MPPRRSHARPAAAAACLLAAAAGAKPAHPLLLARCEITHNQHSSLGGLQYKNGGGAGTAAAHTARRETGRAPQRRCCEPRFSLAQPTPPDTSCRQHAGSPGRGGKAWRRGAAAAEAALHTVGWAAGGGALHMRNCGPARPPARHTHKWQHPGQLDRNPQVSAVHRHCSYASSTHGLPACGSLTAPSMSTPMAG